MNVPTDIMTSATDYKEAKEKVSDMKRNIARLEQEYSTLGTREDIDSSDLAWRWQEGELKEKLREANNNLIYWMGKIATYDELYDCEKKAEIKNALKDMGFDYA